MPTYCDHLDAALPDAVLARLGEVSNYWGGCHGNPPHPEEYVFDADDRGGISELDLPDSLEILPDGAIRIKGHRISLYLILDTIYSGGNLPALRKRFPALPGEQLWEVALFCTQYHETMWLYYRKSRRKLYACAQEYRRAMPSREELLRRAKDKGIDFE